MSHLSAGVGEVSQQLTELKVKFCALGRRVYHLEEKQDGLDADILKIADILARGFWGRLQWLVFGI